MWDMSGAWSACGGRGEKESVTTGSHAPAWLVQKGGGHPTLTPSVLVDEVNRDDLFVLVLQPVEVAHEDGVLLLLGGKRLAGLVLEVGHLGPHQRDGAAHLVCGGEGGGKK